MKKAIPVLALLFAISVFSSGCAIKQIEDGETGVKADFGKIQDAPLTTGWHFYLPISKNLGMNFPDKSNIFSVN